MARAAVISTCLAEARSTHPRMRRWTRKCITSTRKANRCSSMPCAAWQKWLAICWRSRRSEKHTSELQSRLHLVCRLLLLKKKKGWEASPCHYPSHADIDGHHLVRHLDVELLHREAAGVCDRVIVHEAIETIDILRDLLDG